MTENVGLGTKRVDVRKLIWLFIRNLHVIAIFTITSYSTAWLYLRYTPSIYQANLKIQLKVLENEVLASLESKDVYSENSTTAFEALKSRELIKQVVDGLNLTVDYFKKGTVLTADIYKASPFKLVYDSSQSLAGAGLFQVRPLSAESFALSLQNIDLPEVTARFGEPVVYPPGSKTSFALVRTPNTQLEVGATYLFRVQNQEAVVKDIVARLSIKPTSSADIYDLSFQDEVAQKGIDILHMLADLYLKQELFYNKLPYQQTVSFIDTLIYGMQFNVDSTNQILVDYEKRNSYPSTQIYREYLSTQYTSYLTDLDQIQAKASALANLSAYVELQLENDYDSLVFAPNTLDLLPPDIVEVVDALNTSILEYRSALSRLTPTSLPVLNIRQRIQNYSLIFKEVVANTRQALRQKEANTRAALRELARKLEGSPEKDRDLESIKKDFTFNQSIFDLLKQRKTETLISMAGVVSQSRIIDRAYASPTPVSPNRKLIMLAGLVLGFLGGISLVIIRDSLRRTVRDMEDLESGTSLGIVGEVIRNRYQRQRDSARLIADQGTQSAHSESFRAIRNNLEFILSNKKRNVIAVTSTISREGKSYFSINLAYIYTLLGKKVLVVDADLRKSKLHKSLGLINDYGLSTHLIGRDSFEEVIQKSAHENLFMISAGPVPPNPSELLTTPQFEAFVNKASEMFDIVIIDTSPVGLVTDAVSVIRQVSVTLYIFRANYSRVEFLRFAERFVKDNAILDLYLVFNYAPTHSRLGYGYGYGYGRTDGGYYVNAKKKPWWQFWRRS